MRGIILAGGTGSRLGPLTKSVNKHLLNVGGVPMIYHPLRVLRDNGIEDITVVSSPSGVGQLAALLGSGAEHGCRFTYRVQDQPGGIGQALACALDEPEEMAVILGDNVFLPSPIFTKHKASCDAICFLAALDDLDALRQFGVAFFGAPDRLDAVVEKPPHPPSKFAATGLYVLPIEAQLHLHQLAPSARGEVEIVDLLNHYGKTGTLTYQKLTGFWGDAGTVEGMAECAAAVHAWEGSK